MAHTNERVPEQGPTERLSTFLRASAEGLFARILAAECERYVASFEHLRDSRGRDAIVRNGYQPRREVETGIGPVPVRVPKVRSRTDQQAVFHSSIVPRYLRRTRVAGREAVWRYLYGLWCCDLNQILVALLGSRGAHLAGSIPESMRRDWASECSHRNASAVGPYPAEIWAECITPDPLWQVAPGSILAVIGTDASGSLSLLALDHGLADMGSRWARVAHSLHSRGLRMPALIHAGGDANGLGRALVSDTPASAPRLPEGASREDPRQAGRLGAYRNS